MMLEAPERSPPEDLNADAKAWVREILDGLGIDMTRLAKNIGMSQSTLSKALGKKPTRPISDLALQRIAEFAGRPVPAHILARAVRGRTPRGEEQTPDRVRPHDIVSGAVAPGPEQDVPVWAAIRAGPDNLFGLNQVAMEWARRHRGIAGARSVAALRMPGEFMAPWRRPNELIYVNPNQNPFAGDHALLKLVDGTGGGPLWTLLQLDAAPVLGLPPSGRWHTLPGRAPLNLWRVVQAARVIEWPELVG